MMCLCNEILYNSENELLWHMSIGMNLLKIIKVIRKITEVYMQFDNVFIS